LKLISTFAVLLWIAQQLAVGAPLAHVLARSPHHEPELARPTSRDVVLTRLSERSPHRLAWESSPSIPPHRPSAALDDAPFATIDLPRARSNVRARYARFADPRGPPQVIAS
jgi:hypothetical protein